MANSSAPFRGGTASLFDYVKGAFLYRWNVLLFLGGVAAAALSPWPDAALPLVAAIEAAYLGGVISIPKFRKAIDAGVHQKKRSSKNVESERVLRGLIAGLPAESRERFERVKRRCVEMRDIAAAVRGRNSNAAGNVGTDSLDRLLWVFLRLLVSQGALDRFAASASLEGMRKQHKEVKQAFEKAGVDDERIRRSLEDSIKVHEKRIENYAKAEADREFVKVEIDRIQAKILALTESSIGRQDAELLSSQIDSVAESMESTEQAITHLEQLTGIVDQLNEPPQILSALEETVEQ